MLFAVNGVFEVNARKFICTERCLDAERSSEPGGGDVETRATGLQPPASTAIRRSELVRRTVGTSNWPAERKPTKPSISLPCVIHLARLGGSKQELRDPEGATGTASSRDNLPASFKFKSTFQWTGEYSLHFVHEHWRRQFTILLGRVKCAERSWLGQIYNGSSKLVLQTSWVFLIQSFLIGGSSRHLA